MGKKGFVLYKQWRHLFAGLPADMCAELINAVFSYQCGDEPEIKNAVVQGIFNMIAEQFREDSEKYEGVVVKRREAAQKRWEAAQANAKNQDKDDASRCKPMQTDANTCKSIQVDTDKELELDLDKELVLGLEETNVSSNKTHCPAERVKTTKAEPDYVGQIVEYLNLVCGTRYSPKSKDTRHHINARLAEGFTVDDFKTVIDKMSKVWKNDSKMSRFLRPETLFCTKFESYLNWQVASRLDVVDQWTKEIEYGNERVFDSGEKYQSSLSGNDAG